MGWFQKLSAGLSKTRDAVTGQLDRMLGRAADPALLDELEVALISADLGLPVVERIMEQLRSQMRGGNFSSAENVRDLLRRSILDILLPAQSVSMHQMVAQGPHPFVILVVGVNGVGKTSLLEAIELILCGRILRNPDSDTNNNSIEASYNKNKSSLIYVLETP